MEDDQIIDEDQYLEEDIKTILRYLRAHKPGEANIKEAVRLRALMQKLAEKLAATDMEFAELLLKAMEEEKAKSENDNQPEKQTD